MPLKIGEVLEGKISGIMKFGAFVSFEDGTSGLVHISEISNEYVEDINNHLKVGQTVSAKVLTIDDNGKVALSIKQTLEGYTPQPPRQSRPKFERGPRPPRPAPVPFDPSKPPAEFTPVPSKKTAPANSFEEKMLRFKQDSEEKMHSLKRDVSGKRRKGN